MNKHEDIRLSILLELIKKDSTGVSGLTISSLMRQTEALASYVICGTSYSGYPKETPTRD